MSIQYNNLRIINGFSGPGAKERAAVKTVAVTNFNLNTNLIGAVISGYTVSDGDRVLFTAQNTQSENGIYVISATSYRAPDYNTSEDLSFSMIPVTNGTYANSIFRATTTVTFVQDSLLTGTGYLYRSDKFLSYRRESAIWVPYPVNVTFNDFIAVGVFCFMPAIYPATAQLIFETVIGTASLTLRVTPGISTTTYTTSGFQIINLNLPSVNTRLILEVKRNSTEDVPVIYGVQISF